MAEQFFHDLFTGAHKSADAQQAEFEKQRDEDIGMYQQTLHAPPGTVSPEQRVRAAQQIGKLRNLKKGENPYEKVAGFLNTLGDHITKKAPGNVPTGLTGMTPMNDITPSSGAPDATSPKVGFGKKLLGTAAKGLGAGVEVAGNLLTGGDRQQLSSLPPLDAKTFDTPPSYVVGKKVDNYTGQDGYKYDIYQRPDGSRYEQRSENKMRGYQRPIQQGTVSLQDAKKQSAGGTKFNGEDGQPIDVSKLPPDMALLHIKQEDQSYYVPVSQKQKVVKLGGKNYGITEFGLMELPEELQSGDGTARELGPSVVGKTTDTSNRLYGKETTQTPQTPGVTAQPAPSPSDDQSAPPSGTPQKPGLTPLSASPASSDTTTAPTPSGRTGGAKKSLPGLSGSKVGPDAPAHAVTASGKLGPPIPNMQMQKQANAINEARNSLIGDTPGQLGGIAGDLSVFNDPGSVKRLSEYIGFINSNLDDASKDVTGKGVWAAVDWYAGIPRTVENLKQEALRKVGRPLSPNEEKFVADYYRLMGTIGGMRAATGASAAKWNFTNLRGELPTPGIVTQYGDAVNRLRNFTHETNVVSQYNPLIKPVDDKMLDQLGSGTTERWVRKNGKIVKELTGGSTSASK